MASLYQQRTARCGSVAVTVAEEARRLPLWQETGQLWCCTPSAPDKVGLHTPPLERKQATSLHSPSVPSLVRLSADAGSESAHCSRC